MHPRSRRSSLSPLLVAFFLAGAPALASADLHGSATQEKAPLEAAATLVSAGSLPRLSTRVNGGLVALPLEHTDVEISISGFVARAEVSQRFGNPFETPIEAIYTFPLPERAAVDGFRMRIGERVIEGTIKKRAIARRIYQAARKAGQTTSLLEQERPNIFTQSLANIAPGQSIVVTLEYVQTLPYDEGAFELAFPMVVGPRFFPGAAPLAGPKGAGSAVDTISVPEASRMSPPSLPAQTRSGHDLTLRVSLAAGLPIRDFEVPTHDVSVQAEGDTRLFLSLEEHETIPNRDFVLRWWVDAHAVQAGLLTHTDARGKFFSLMITPPTLDVASLVGDRELVFVVDVSGSMNGLPLWLAKKAMATALSRVRPHDTFNVITFAGSPGRLWETSRPATERNIALARDFVDRMSAGGGTQMLDAVAAALGGEIEARRHRYVFFLTDGYVGNETQIIAAARHHVTAHDRADRRARVFTLGIGSSVNRMLIEGLAKAGRGTRFVATNREDPARAVDAFFRRIDHPVLLDLSLDFGSLPVRALSIYPRRLPDLFASRPLLILGRYDRHGRGVITLRARTEDGRVIRMPIEIDLPAVDSSNEALPTLWAREKIQALDDSIWDAGHGEERNKRPDIRTAITRLGLDYHLLTAYTAFVAVDRSRGGRRGVLPRFVQPVELPEDVDGRVAGSLSSLPTRYARIIPRRRARPAPSARQAPPLASGTAREPLPLPSPPGIGGLGTRGAGYGGGGRATTVGGFGVLGGTGAGAGVAALRAARAGGKTDASGERGPLPGAQVVVYGALSRALIVRVIRRHRGEIRRCYEQALSKRPWIMGKVIVTFTIRADGGVQKPKITSTTVSDTRFERCITARVAAWRFPAPTGGGVVVVSYPWVFNTKM